MIRRDVLHKLPIEILESDRELRNRLMRFLHYSIELVEQFLLQYLSVKKFEELCVNVLKCRKFPRLTVGVPLHRGSVEGQCEFSDLGGIDLCNGEMLRRMVGLPSRHKRVDVRLRV